MFLLAFLIACVESSVPVAYLERHEPKCTGFAVQNHSYNDGNGNSLTEISYQCGSTKKTETIKCRFHWGCISDTTCYVNN